MPYLLQAADGSIAAYPYTLAALQADHPGTVFFWPMAEADLLDFGVVPVLEVAPPQAALGGNITEVAPIKVQGVWTQQWEETAATASEIAARRQRQVDDIDNAVASIYTRVGRFADEYKDREAAALAFQAAGYAGPVPLAVAAFATPAGVTPTYATNLILSQAAQLRGALAALGELRMRKYEVKTAAIGVAEAAYADVMASIRAIGSAL